MGLLRTGCHGRFNDVWTAFVQCRNRSDLPWLQRRDPINLVSIEQLIGFRCGWNFVELYVM